MTIKDTGRVWVVRVVQFARGLFLDLFLHIKTNTKSQFKSVLLCFTSFISVFFQAFLLSKMSVVKRSGTAKGVVTRSAQAPSAENSVSTVITRTSAVVAPPSPAPAPASAHPSPTHHHHADDDEMSEVSMSSQSLANANYHCYHCKTKGGRFKSFRAYETWSSHMIKSHKANCTWEAYYNKYAPAEESVVTEFGDLDSLPLNV